MKLVLTTFAWIVSVSGVALGSSAFGAGKLGPRFIASYMDDNGLRWSTELPPNDWTNGCIDSFRFRLDKKMHL